MIKTIWTRAFVSALLTALLCICIGAAVIVTSASASAEGDGTVKFSECSAQTGKTASVTVSLENNPGVAILSMTLDYDKTALTLADVKNGELLDTLDEGLNLFWSADGNSTTNGVLATLTFDVAEDAEAKDYIISAVINEAYNEDFEPVELAISDGKVTVYDFIYGDANGDWATNGMDVLLLRKYMANYDYETGISTVTVGKGADANGDGTVSAADVLLLRKYMANYNYDTGSSTVVLGPQNTQPPVTSESPVTTVPVTTEPPITTEAPVTTAPPVTTEPTVETVMADASDVALEYISWQAAINGCASYDEKEEQITFVYNGVSYTFSDLKPAQIDVYSYDRIKRIIALEKNIETTFFDVETLYYLRVDVSDDEEELQIALTSIVDYCTDMISEFYSIVLPVHSALASVQDQYPLLGVNKKNNDWKTNSKVSGDMVLSYAMYGRLTGSHGEDYKLIRDAVYAVLNTSTYKFKSLVGYGTSNGNATAKDTANSDVTIELWPTSYQGAIYSVDPLKYAVRNADDKITGFDSAAYKAALNTAIDSVYAKFLPEYVKDVKQAGDFDAIVTRLATIFYNYGIWNVEGEIVIDDETYTYAIASDGKTSDLVVYDSYDEKVSAANPIIFKYDNVEYIVDLTVVKDFVNGKFAIVPTVSPEVPDAKKDVYDLLGLKVEDLTYDIRDYADEIGANFAKIGTVKALGDNSNYRTTNATELQTIFNYEKQNDFYSTFETLCARMYNKASVTSVNWGSFGSYIEGWDGMRYVNSIRINIVDADTFDAILVLSKLARDKVYAMTAENNTVEEIENEFHKFTVMVKAVLIENGYTFETSETSDGYEFITTIHSQIN